MKVKCFYNIGHRSPISIKLQAYYIVVSIKHMQLIWLQFQKSAKRYMAAIRYIDPNRLAPTYLQHATMKSVCAKSIQIALKL